MDSDSDNAIIFSGKVQCLPDYIRKLPGPQDQRIRRGNNYVGVRILTHYLPTRISDARSRISRNRFCKNLINRYLWQLFPDDIHISFRSHHPYSGRIAHRQESFHSKLYERFTNTEKVNELLRRFRRTDRPKPGTDTTCHYDYVCIHILSIFLLLSQI